MKKRNTIGMDMGDRNPVFASLIIKEKYCREIRWLIQQLP